MRPESDIAVSPPSASAAWRPNLDWLMPDLAVGGRFSCDEAERLARVMRIRAIVDLRAEACDDEAVLRRHGIAFRHLPTDDHCAIGPTMLRAGVAFVNRHLDDGNRVLVHCEHGIGRSATLALCVLVSRGMAPLDALELAKTRRAAISPSPAQYEAWAAWLRGHKNGSETGWDVPPFDAFKAIAYRHLRDGGD
jgi:protein-tyrosine phosphatase